MTSSDILTRENSLEVPKLSSPADDNVALKLQKKSAKILSDKDQLKQVSFSDTRYIPKMVPNCCDIDRTT